MEIVGKNENLLAEKKLLSALNNLPPLPDFTKHFCARNAKILAVFSVIGFIIYHSVLLETLGSDSCHWLLSDGRFQGSRWQPFGCMMHSYSRSHASSCMNYISYWNGRNQMVFLGDEKTKKLFISFVDLLDGDGKEEDEDSDESPHTFRALKIRTYQNYTNQEAADRYGDARNEHYEKTSIGLDAGFWYFSYMDEKFMTKLKEYKDRPEKHRPTTIVIGLPLGDLDQNKVDIFNLTDNSWKSNLEQVKNLLSQIDSKDTDIVWNLQEPSFDVKGMHPNESSAINHAIDSYNRAALEHFENSKIRLWTSSRLIAQIFQKNKTLLNETEHSQLDTQILLNYKCNGNMYYPDGTCCTVTEKPTLLQFLTAFIFVLSISFSIIMFCACHRDVRESKTTAGDDKADVYKPRNIEPSRKVILYEVLKGFSKLGIIVAYAYLCDRTTFFMKENKSYTHLNFLFPLGYVMLIGLFWAKDSEHTEILHRDQTDEWKGWMQLVILIYHFTGASQVLPVYMFIRCLVTAYVFLSAYGNFMYSWNTGDYSVYRYFRVMVRYNLLVVCLCLVMNRPYQFYYFVPLISFWYTVMFLTAALWPRANSKNIDANFKRMWYLIVKLIILATLTTLLYNFDTVFEKIFSANPIRPLFINRDSTDDWHFRWSLDRYSSLFGVMFALFVIYGHKYGVIHDKDNESYLFKHDAVNIVTTFLSVASFIGYAIMVVMCQSQESPKKYCNNLHSYVAFLPIIGYILIRNVAGPIRTLYSPFFAWFGKFALELFVAQYHIWLAADTAGILVLVPNYPIINVAVTTLIFVSAAHELHNTTAKLTNYLVPLNWIGLTRNLLIFCALMVPVAIYSGAFNL